MEDELIMPFYDESESFALGVEIGRLDTLIRMNVPVINYLVHSENSAQIQTMCDVHGKKCLLTIIDDQWADLSIY